MNRRPFVKVVLAVTILAFCFFVLAPAAQARAGAQVKIDDELRPIGAPKASTGQEAVVGEEGTAQYAASGVQQILGKIILTVIQIAGVVAVYFVVSSGFYLVISQGSQEKIDEQKKALFWAIFGLVLIIISYSFFRFLFEILLQVEEAAAPAAAAPAAYLTPADAETVDRLFA